MKPLDAQCWVHLHSTVIVLLDDSILGKAALVAGKIVPPIGSGAGLLVATTSRQRPPAYRDKSLEVPNFSARLQEPFIQRWEACPTTCSHRTQTLTQTGLYTSPRRPPLNLTRSPRPAGKIGPPVLVTSPIRTRRTTMSPALFLRG